MRRLGAAFRLVGLFAALLVAWLLWSGLYYPMLLALGVLSCLGVVLLARRMGIVDPEAVPIHLGWRIFFYWAWLLKEIVVGALSVTRIILSPKPNISPSLVSMKAGQKSDLGRVILGNSITLNPGSVTIQLDGDELTVHCLTAEGAQSLLTGSANERVSNLEK